MKGIPLPKRMSPEIRSGAAMARRMWQAYTRGPQFSVPTWRDRKRTMAWCLSYGFRCNGVNKRYEDLLNMAGETTNSVEDHMLNSKMERWARRNQDCFKSTALGAM
jgi:hypothetical protein